MPDAHEEPHFERTSFRVGKKIFATMTKAGDEAMVRVDPDGVHALLSSSPDVFFSYGGFTTRNGSVGIHLAKADRAMLKELVTDSWKHSAPKRTVTAFEATEAKKTAPRTR